MFAGSCPGKPVLREELSVLGKEPYRGVGVQQPVAPLLGIAELGFEGPVIDADVGQLGLVVLAGRDLHEEADAQQRLCFHFLNCGIFIAGPPFKFTDKRTKPSLSPER